MSCNLQGRRYHRQPYTGRPGVLRNRAGRRVEDLAGVVRIGGLFNRYWSQGRFGENMRASGWGGVLRVGTCLLRQQRDVTNVGYVLNRTLLLPWGIVFNKQCGNQVVGGWGN